MRCYLSRTTATIQNERRVRGRFIFICMAEDGFPCSTICQDHGLTRLPSMSMTTESDRRTPASSTPRRVFSHKAKSFQRLRKGLDFLRHFAKVALFRDGKLADHRHRIKSPFLKGARREEEQSRSSKPFERREKEQLAAAEDLGKPR